MKLSGICTWLALACCQLLLLSTVMAQTRSEDAAWKKLHEAGQRSFVQADYAEAEKQLQASLKRAQDIKSQIAIAESCEALAKLYDEQEKFEQGELHYLCLLKAREKILGRDNYLLGETLLKLIEVYGKNDRYAKAAEMALRFQKIVEKKLSPTHQEAVGLLEMAGFLYAMAGNQAEAEKYVKLAKARKTASEKTPPRIADGDDLLRQDENSRKGMEAYGKGKIAESQQHYENALKAAEASGRRDHLLAVILEAVAGNYRAQQKPSASVPYYERAVALREELLPWVTPELIPRLNFLSLRISSLISAYESADNEDPAKREKWIKGGVKEFPKTEALLKKDIALWERAVGTEHINYAARLDALKKYYLDRFAESYRELRERLQEQWKREGSKPAVSGQHAKESHGELTEMIEKATGGEVRRNSYFVKAMELWKRSLAIKEKLAQPESRYLRGDLEEMALFFRSYGLEPERVAAENQIAAMDATPKQLSASDAELLKKFGGKSLKTDSPKLAAAVETKTDSTRLCQEMNIFALLGPVFSLPLWDQPEFRASGDRLFAGIRSRWGDRPVLEGKFGEVDLDTLKLTVMNVAEHGRLWKAARPIVRTPHQNNRKTEFVRNAKGELEMQEAIPNPRGIALEPDGTARAEFTIQTEFAERKGLFDKYPTRYPRLSLLKLEIFDGEKKLGEQVFKNTRSDWMTNFFAISPEAYRGFRSISWLKVGNRRILIFDNLAEHDSLYGGAFVMCVLPAKPR